MSNEGVNEFYHCDRKQLKDLFDDKYPIFGVLWRFMEGAKWITRCRLNKIKDSWKLSGCLLTQKKKDMGSIRS